MKARNLILFTLLLAVPNWAFASSVRILDGFEITNGAAILLLPTSSDTLIGRATTDTLTNKSISGSANTLTNIPAGTALSGQVPVPNGGTGVASLTANGLIYGNGTSPVGVTSAGSQYQSFQAGASGVPTIDAVHLDQAAAVTGSLPLANGGTGGVDQPSAANAVLPSQSSNSGKFLTTDGTNASWGVVSSVPSIVASRASPTLITAVGGIGFSSAVYDTYNFIAGNAGAVTVTATPQIAVGANVGQRLTLIGRSASNTVTLADGNGLSLNGPWVGGLDSVLVVFWDGTNWTEVARR